MPQQASMLCEPVVTDGRAITFGLTLSINSPQIQAAGATFQFSEQKSKVTCLRLVALSFFATS